MHKWRSLWTKIQSFLTASRVLLTMTPASLGNSNILKKVPRVPAPKSAYLRGDSVEAKILSVAWRIALSLESQIEIRRDFTHSKNTSLAALVPLSFCALSSWKKDFSLLGVRPKQICYRKAKVFPRKDPPVLCINNSYSVLSTQY